MRREWKKEWEKDGGRSKHSATFIPPDTDKHGFVLDFEHLFPCL